MARFKPKQQASLRLDKASVQNQEKVENFKVSFQYFDPHPFYASGFKDWQKDGLLSKALETLHGYSHKPLMEQVDGDKFAIYKSFPPPEKTMFEYPRHVPEDAQWARIHVNGPAVLIGHIVRNTFYLVFLDKTHKFWLSKRATAN